MKRSRNAGITHISGGDCEFTVHDGGILALKIKGDYAANISPLYGDRRGLEVGVQRNFDSDEELKAADVFLHQLAICANAARLDIAKAVAK